MTSSARVTAANDAPIREERAVVLYWMVAARRTRYNPSLERALEHAARLRKPLVVLEALRVGYPWASHRFHRFIIDGMADNARAFDDAGVCYHPYVEPEEGAGKGLLEALADDAAVVVTDRFPAFFLPRMIEAAASRLDVRLEQVDSLGVLPLSETERVYTTAYSFRRFLHKRLRPHLEAMPEAQPLDDYEGPRHDLPEAVLERWPPASQGLLSGDSRLDALPIDPSVGVVSLGGGAEAARARLQTFMSERYPRYGEGRNHPDDDAASGLSPYLHFGHIGAHEILAAVIEAESWMPDALASKPTGKREGWWGMSETGESFIDELITWREIGHVFCHHEPDYDRFTTLPDWAQKTLNEHRSDPREEQYDLETLAQAGTEDPIWNAAQRQLRRTGVMHNYLRMLWGKNVLAWTESPEQAIAFLIELNNRYALDGRDPNSYSGIFWVFGRFDRAWGPERPIYGKVRYMSSASTRRKLHISDYLERFGPE